MSAGDQLVIDSATGVEVALPVVGPGGRAYAFVLDWHIRLALALAWYGSGALLHSTVTRGLPSLMVPFDPGPAYFLGVVLPAAAIYFLYHPVLEIVLRGRTPGKRMAGLRIVTREGNAPGIGALLVRNVFRLIDSFPGVYCVGLVATLVTRDSLRLGDLAAGTLLVYERDRDLGLSGRAPASAARGPDSGLPEATLAAPRAAARAGDDPIAALAAGELVAELEARWDSLAGPARESLARALLQRLGEPESTTAGADEATLKALLASHGAAR